MPFGLNLGPSLGSIGKMIGKGVKKAPSMVNKIGKQIPGAVNSLAHKFGAPNMPQLPGMPNMGQKRMPMPTKQPMPMNEQPNPMMDSMMPPPQMGGGLDVSPSGMPPMGMEPPPPNPMMAPPGNTGIAGGGMRMGNGGGLFDMYNRMKNMGGGGRGMMM